MAIDNGLGEAYASLAWVHDYYDRNVETEAAYKKAIELSPNYALAYHWYSIYIGLSDPQRAQESTDLMHKAAILDPRSGIIGYNLAETYRMRVSTPCQKTNIKKLLISTRISQGDTGV